MSKVAIAGVVALLLAPASALLGIVALLSPAAQAQCLPTASTATSPTAGSSVPETSHVAFPLPAGTWVRTSGFGMRVHPITGEYKLHTGVDLAAPSGTHILAAADGRVAYAGPASGFGHLILIEHTVGGKRVATGYAHMYADGIRVKAGDQVSAGQYIADVGTDGYSSGPHLHFEVRPGGAAASPVDPEPWLNANGAANVEDGASADAAGCTDRGGPAAAYAGENSNHLVDDPTTGGQITERTASVLAQVQKSFPTSHWSCWAERPGTKSEHPLGRACDGTFGNSIGTAASGPALDLGWKVTNWLKANAKTLGVEYLIWQGRIWSVARSAEGWRAYGGGGMHDPNAVTGGHYDHLHFTITAN
ncbi:M23 family metallopeptidase [Nocardioides aurantiacus]|uniref:M23 family metallopeptidase n=1 Tax=Nocardioides aurantiacus TaxID=86796 RepID=UPI00403F8102